MYTFQLDSDHVEPDYLLPRGVYRSPVLGPDGETVIVAVDHNHRRLRGPFGLRSVLPGDNPFPVMEEMWEMLDERDPAPPEWLSQAG